MISKTLLAAGLLLATTRAWAGPPLICHPIDIGSAKSLPWRPIPTWNATDPSYGLSKLTQDTLDLLAPAVPVNVRRETLRRAAIYASSDARMADDLTARLLARTLDAEAAGKPSPQAWFDAGYFVETLRQATFIYKYDMLSAKERAAWKLRGETPRLDGYTWVQRAIQLGGKNMESALALMQEYRNADIESRPQVKVAVK